MCGLMTRRKDRCMGYEDELDKTFEMVDQLSDVDGKKKNPSGTKGGNK